MNDRILALQNGTRSTPVFALAKAEPEEINDPETGEDKFQLKVQLQI